MATLAERSIVRERAEYRCEYCKAPEDVTGYSFHIEHIIPKSSGGRDHMENYALACMHCNRSKSNHITGTDTQTGSIKPIFNPRTHRWNEHFHVRLKIYLKGRTEVGRATVNRLEMNNARQLEARRLWRQLNIFP